MDDNVMKKYASKADKATEYVQYNQGLYGLHTFLSFYAPVISS